LNFAFKNLSLGLATHGALLAYPAFTTPSLPPRDVNSLRLLHGSCRIPHGNGRDALKLADDLIGQAQINALARPHQLLLMGDQIYADDSRRMELSLDGPPRPAGKEELDSDRS